MPKLQLVKNAFNTGEISPFAMGRTDFQGQSGNKYDHACESLQNFIPLIQGGVTKRPGTVFVAQTHQTSARLIPFKRYTGPSFVLELADQLMRFYSSDAVVTDAQTTTVGAQTLPVGTINVVSTAGFPTSGFILVGGQIVAYTGLSGGNKFTGCTSGVGNIAAGTAVGHRYTIATPWHIADVFGIKFAQINDIMYLVHPSYPVQKLSFISAASWTLSAPNFQPAPSHEFDTDYSGGTISLTLGVTAAGNTGNFTTSANFWLAGDVGRYVVIGSGIAYISAITSPTIAVVTVIDTFASGSAAAGTWFLRGAPSGIICAGFIDGSNNFHSTTVFGPSNQALYSFATYPINLNSVASIGFLDCFRPQDQGSYLVFSGATAIIGSVTNAHAIVIQIIGSVIQTTLPFTNPTTGASAIIMQAQSAGTWTIETPSFSGANGYPQAVCFFQDRLMLASTSAQPQNIWGSQTGDYENFSKGAQDDNALDEEINSGFREPIYWLAAYQGQIAAGTPESEYIISGGAGGLPGAGVGAAITPTNFSAAIQSRYGVANIQPIFIESHLVYIQRAAQIVYEFSYDIYQGIFGSKNLNILHDIVTTAGWKEVAYAEMPYRLVCFIDKVGNLCTLTYNREQDVWAWARHYTGQDGTTPDTFQSVTSILGPGGLSDEIWFIVNRVINGVTIPCVEYINVIKNQVVAGDSATIGTFSPAQGTITGLGYLFGRVVWVAAVTSGGGALANFGPYQIDATGQITLPVGITATSVQLGLVYCGEIVTVRPELQGGQTIQGLLKQWSRIWVRLYNTVGITINGVLVPFRQPSTPMTQGVPAPVAYNPDVTAAEAAPPISTVYNPVVTNSLPGYTFATFDERVENLGYDRDGRVIIQQHLPLPATVLAMFGQLNVGER